MLDPEQIKSLKEKIESDTIFDLSYLENTSEENIFYNYKKNTEIEDKIEEYLKIINEHKSEISKNILHNNSKVRAIFSKYMSILKEMENYLLSKKDDCNNLKTNLIEDFSNLFKEKEIS